MKPYQITYNVASGLFDVIDRATGDVIDVTSSFFDGDQIGEAWYARLLADQRADAAMYAAAAYEATAELAARADARDHLHALRGYERAYEAELAAGDVVLVLRKRGAGYANARGLRAHVVKPNRASAWVQVENGTPFKVAVCDLRRAA